MTEAGETTLLAAEWPCEIDASSVPLRPKGDVLAVWRPRGRRIVRGVVRDLNRSPTGSRLHPDVLVAALVGGVGDELPVRRPGGLCLRSVKERESTQGGAA